MTTDFMNAFLWLEEQDKVVEGRSPQERYQALVTWAAKARGRNPGVFDALTVWMLNDANWTDDLMEVSRLLLLEDVVDGFRRQNTALRLILNELLPHVPVNEAVFKALDGFDAFLAGDAGDDAVTAAMQRVLQDAGALRDPAVRSLIAGRPTGPTGTNSVDLYGYVNMLNDIDASVQWALFMPERVMQQQKGFSLTHLAYIRASAMRFIGRPDQGLDEANLRRETFRVLDALARPLPDYPWDMCFSHHFGKGVDVQPPQHTWGRFFAQDTPVPDGFVGISLSDQYVDCAGEPYLAQFAYSVFAGDMHALHDRQGFDVGPMCDITRNTMLGQGVMIPYPRKYWTAEIYRLGNENPSDAYLFSAHL